MAYQIQTPARQCSRTGRELRPGEKCYSVLHDRNGQWVREDIGAEAWTGPPEGAFAFWRTQVPRDAAAKAPQVDDELLMECFTRLETETDPRKLSFRYLLAIMLMRRKRLRFESVRRDGQREWLQLREVRKKRLHEVLDPQMTEAELAAAQDDMASVLGLN